MKNTPHKTKHPSYYSWQNMKARCYNPNATGYEKWGGRGITVCDEWRDDFWQFATDMGSKPTGFTLDRIDNDGDYTPDNCRWATHSDQIHNQRRRKDGVDYTYGGETLSEAEWARRLGVPKSRLTARRRLGWSVPDILGTPANGKYGRMKKGHHGTPKPLSPVL